MLSVMSVKAHAVNNVQQRNPNFENVRVLQVFARK